MKKKREIPPKLLSIRRQYASCFVTFFAAFLIGLAVSVILNFPIGLVLIECSEFAEDLTLVDAIRDLAGGITGLVGALITIFVLSFLEGYYKNKFVFKQLLSAIALTFVTLVILNLILGHSVWFSGPTMFFASYVFEQKHFEIMGTKGAKQILENYRWFFMVIAFWVLYAPSMILGKYLGSKKGNKDSEKAKKEKSKEKTLNEHPFD